MDNNQKPSSAAVDDILQELKRKQGTAAPGGRSVDDILKEIKTPAATRPPAAPAPVAPPPPPAPQAAPRPAAPAGAQPARPVAARPAAPATPAAAPPKTAAPAPQPPAEPDPKKRRKNDLSATIYDIDMEGERTDMGPRMGKAAALDRVDHEKFTGDEELLSWFSPDEEEGLSKKEQKRIDKLKKQQEKEARKEAKRRRKRGEDEDEEDALYAAGDLRGIAPVYSDDEPDGPNDEMNDDTYDEDGVKIWGEAPATRQAPPPVASTKPDEPVNWAPGDDFFSEGADIAPPPPVDFIDATPPPAIPVAQPAAAPPPAAKVPDAEEDRTGPVPVPTAPVAATTAAAMAAATGTPQAATQVFAKPVTEKPPEKPAPAQQAGTLVFDIDALSEEYVEIPTAGDGHDTKSFDLNDEEKEDGRHVPTAAFTQEFGEDGLPIADTSKNLFVEDMVDDRFRQFFGETVVVDEAKEEEMLRLAKEEKEKNKTKRRRKKSRSAVLTGEFGKLAEQAERAERAETENIEKADDFDDYNHLQDAEAIEEDIVTLRTTLTRRCIAALGLGLLLVYLALAHLGTVPFPEFGPIENQAALFAGVYLAALLAVIIVNFTTVASGLVGLFGEPTVDSAPALASLAALLQGVMLMVNAFSTLPPNNATLFGALAAFLLGFNALGKRVRAVSILSNFQLASAGYDHSAAYIVDSSTDLAYNITQGMNEEFPTLLVSRPTALVKGFLRQSFSQRAVDRRGKLLGWGLLVAGVAVAVIAWWMSEDLFSTVTAFAATLCIAAPFSSSLVSGIPSLLMQRGTARVGAVVPGWSAIEELGDVNVVMAGARDIFPPNAVSLKGIKTFEKERIDLAILYAASVLIEGCDTLKDIFMGVIQGKSDMLYKVESLTREPQRGFTAWVQNSRIVIGTREMLQKHDIEPPPIEVEMKFVPEGHLPVYLAVSGKLFAMFIISYGADEEVHDTLHGLLRSGVSLLIDSNDMNVTSELVERVYDLPPGAVKVLGPRELELMEPLTAYLPESDGVMTHIGSFASFIGGMRAAAACASAEKMANIVQIASSALACALCVLLAVSGGLAVLSLTIALAYQLGWTLLVSALPAVRKY